MQVHDFINHVLFILKKCRLSIDNLSNTELPGFDLEKNDGVCLFCYSGDSLYPYQD